MGLRTLSVWVSWFIFDPHRLVFKSDEFNSLYVSSFERSGKRYKYPLAWPGNFVLTNVWPEKRCSKVFARLQQGNWCCKKKERHVPFAPFGKEFMRALLRNFALPT